ncbi:hypothetical protein F4779DRAFT_607263 [Xylariaceae sp. FL0662B]|nr:hypothetical protein F4779DRAFT_607263 [Xylariaceae sp. FL0662B]
MKSFARCVVILAAIASGAAARWVARAEKNCTETANANVCLGDHGQGDCLPKPFDLATCYDLPADWVGKVKTLTPLDDGFVCLANFMDCAEATQDICYASPECKGYVLLSMSNPAGWDLEAAGLKERVQSFSCFKNGTLPALPTAVSTLEAPTMTAT